MEILRDIFGDFKRYLLFLKTFFGDFKNKFIWKDFIYFSKDILKYFLFLKNCLLLNLYEEILFKILKSFHIKPKHDKILKNEKNI